MRIRSLYTKVLLYLLLVSLLPLIVVSFLLVTSANSHLLEAASAKQHAVASDLVDRVNNYLASKINSLVYESKIYSAGNTNQTITNENLAVLFNQDSDLKRVALLNASGMEAVVFDRNGQVQSLHDESNTDAFKAISFLAGQDYVSSVSYDAKHQPLITIAVPVLASNFAEHLNQLSQANFGTYTTANDLRGTLVANYNISDLWKGVLSTKIGQGGYAYVVDGLGNLVAHPDNNFLATHQKLSDVDAVKQFINGNVATRATRSETGQNVISTPRITSYSGWAVIVEEPVSSIYAGINAYIQLSATIGISAIIMAIILSLFIGRQLTVPIKQLTLGAKRLGLGEFGQTIKIHTKDELQELAETFNKMSADIKKLVGDLQTNNINLVVEQTKLNNIISSVSDGVIALNNKGDILSINPPAARLISKEPSELLQKPLVDFFHWEQEGKILRPELHKTGLYHYTDLILPTGNGNNVAYLDLMVSVLEHQESDVAAIITIHNLTQSRELDYMKLDFVAIAAHELRTPLTVVRGYLNLLNSDGIKQLSIANIENLQKAIVGARQLGDLINKLLNIARIERGEMEIFLEKLDLSKLVKTNVSQHEPAALQNEQRITFHASTDKPIYVPADPASLNEVLNNLIGNALKFSGPGGEVKVNVAADNGVARVEVNDNGPGVPPQLRPRLFTKFYRAERSLISGTRGTGLGLFISKTIIDLQHGTIGIAPDSGKGSTFYFTLPIYDSEKHDKLVTNEKETGGIHGWFKKRHAGRR